MADNPSGFQTASAPEDETVWLTGWRKINVVTGQHTAVITEINLTNDTIVHYDRDTGAVDTLGANEFYNLGYSAFLLAGGLVPSVEEGNVAGASDLSSLTGSLTAGAYTYAQCFVHDADGIIYTMDGTDPDSATESGFRLNNGAYFKLESNDEINNFKFFNLGTGADTGIYVVIYTTDPLNQPATLPSVMGDIKATV